MRVYPFDLNSESHIKRKDELSCIVLALTLKDDVENFSSKQKLLDYDSNISETYIAADFDRENSYLWGFANNEKSQVQING